MLLLPYTTDNVTIVEEFLRETRGRIANGGEITFTRKASKELEILNLQHNITADDIEYTILNLTPENYYRGIDPSGKADFKVCAFRAFTGAKNLEVYLKYGLEADGLQILVFSNHIPDFPMDQPFKK
ncbi:MAG: hypothetical protein R2751_14425 [Bacteroidales bacterium]